MTTLHAGGKFGGEDTGYKVSGGLHGVGASVVNALVHLHESPRPQERRHGQERHIHAGIQARQSRAKVKNIGSTKMHGTIVIFEPDPEIFKEGIEFEWSRVVAHMREQAYLVRGLRISRHRRARASRDFRPGR